MSWFMETVSIVIYVYVPRKMNHGIVPKRNKNNLLLATLDHDDSIDPEIRKQEIKLLFNNSKGWVDVVHQLCTSYNRAHATSRWHMVIDNSILNVAAINSLIIHKANNSTQIARSQQEHLSWSFLDYHLRRRSSNRYVTKLLRLRMKEMRDLPTEELLRQQAFQRRCSNCLSKKNSETKYCCQKCIKFICVEHCIMICKNCLSRY